MSGFDWTAIPHNVLARILDLERRLDDLEGYASLPVVDPGGEGTIIYYNITQAIENSLGNIILFTSVIISYPLTDAGMASAVLASSVGDVIFVPPVTLVNDYTIKAGVTFVGLSIDDSIFT